MRARFTYFVQLIVWIVAFQAIAFLLGILTQTNIEPWYNGLNKSSLTPPGVVFSIVWGILYVLLAFITWYLVNRKKENSKLVVSLYGVQMLMNWAWTPLFFQFHWLKLSAIWLIALTCLNFILIVQAKTQHKTIALLLIPYVVWLCFASYLNLFIAIMN